VNWADSLSAIQGAIPLVVTRVRYVPGAVGVNAWLVAPAAVAGLITVVAPVRAPVSEIASSQAVSAPDETVKSFS
jgi:hypothetical protein